MDDCIAALDVGKSNKKVVVYDAQRRRLKAISETIDERIDRGLLCEPAEQTAHWHLANLKALSAGHVIRAISVSAHIGSSSYCE